MPNEILVSFESGHYKKIHGTWKGDSVWGHFNKASGGQVHINRDKVEYIETFSESEDQNSLDLAKVRESVEAYKARLEKSGALD